MNESSARSDTFYEINVGDTKREYLFVMYTDWVWACDTEAVILIF